MTPLLSLYSSFDSRIRFQGPIDEQKIKTSYSSLLLQVQSAFMIDLNQVSLSLRNCTKRTLILLDEFGKGTLSTGESRG